MASGVIFLEGVECNIFENLIKGGGVARANAVHDFRQN